MTERCRPRRVSDKGPLYLSSLLDERNDDEQDTIRRERAKKKKKKSDWAATPLSFLFLKKEKEKGKITYANDGRKSGDAVQ